MNNLNTDFIDPLILYDYSKYVLLFVVIGLLSTSAFCIYSTNYINYKNDDNDNIYFNKTTDTLITCFITVFALLYLIAFLILIYNNDIIKKSIEKINVNLKNVYRN